MAGEGAGAVVGGRNARGGWSIAGLTVESGGGDPERGGAVPGEIHDTEERAG